MRISIVLLLTASFLAPLHGTAAPITVASPDGSVELRLSVDSSRPEFSATLNGIPVLEPSPLILTIDGVDVTAGARVQRSEFSRLFETYASRGTHSIATNHCHTAVLSVRHERSRMDYQIELRSFNDGVAFRYIVPGGTKPRVPDEHTRFVVPSGSRVWHQDLDGHYEGQHRNHNEAEIEPGKWIAPPMTYKLPRGGYAAITEAALMRYSGMALQRETNGFRLALAHRHPPSYPFLHRFGTNEAARLSRPASIDGTILTPWRVVMIAPDLNAIVNSDIVQNLCPPADPRYFPQGMATDWIKPGRAVWKYLDGGSGTIEGTREFCRLAKDLGFEYNVIENYWGRWSDGEMKDVVRYGHKQGVGLFVWRHTRNLRTPEARDTFFSKLHDLGVAGAKIDFFDHEHQEVVDLYTDLLESAAKHRILVIFHGSCKPTGTRRTWPNELIRESVRGMESRRISDRATHDATLPFTRFLAGPADYTPVFFGDRRGNTTWAHQIATAIVFTEPLLTFAANPSTLLSHPAGNLIKSIPATWDETVVLPPSEIGQVAVFARRSGDSWFLGIVNGTARRTLQMPLEFLGAGEFNGLLVRDDQDADDKVDIQNRSIRSSDTITIHLQSGGGFAGRFTRQP